MKIRKSRMNVKGDINSVFRAGYDWVRHSRVGFALYTLFCFLVYLPMFGKRKTYCPFLWDNVYIDDRGHVFPCCKVRPGMIGSLYENNLLDIWTKSLGLKFFRFMSSHGSLYCFKGCSMIASVQEESLADGNFSLKYPKTVQIMYGEACNLHCVMCSQDHRAMGKIDNRALQRNIDWPKVERVGLAGGEIMAMKEAKEFYIWLTQKMGKKINVVTNGLLVNEEWAEYLVKGSSIIQISVNAARAGTHERVNRGSNFEKVINNIKTMVALKHKFGSDVEIVFKYTIVEENIFEIAEAILLADRIGCDRIAYGFDDVIPAFLAKNIAVAREISCSLRALRDAGNLRMQIKSNVLRYLGLLDS